VGVLSRLGIYRFGARAKCYGILAPIRGRAYVIGALQRGFFYRFGAKIFSPCEGYFDAVFAVKTSVKEVNLMFKVGIKDEVIPVSFRPDWIHGSLHISRTGICSFILTAIDREVFPSFERENLEIFSNHLVEDASYYQSNAKRNTNWLVLKVWKFSVLFGMKGE
jgi:hypothetical protein